MLRARKPDLLVAVALYAFCLAVGAYAVFGVWGASIQPDTLSYVELAEQALRDGGESFISPYWGPLYPAVIASFWATVAPPLEAELFWLHVIAFLSYAVATAGVFRLVVAYLRVQPEADEESGWERLVTWATPAALWLLVAVNWRAAPTLTPDMLVAAIALWATALAMEMAAGRGSAVSSVALGLLLGAGFLTKTAMFPLGVALLVLAAAAGFRDGWAALRRTAVPAGILVLIVGCYAAALTARLGRVSMGDSGRLNHAWGVSWRGAAPVWFGWTGEPEWTGTPVHGPRVVTADPLTLDYGGVFEEATLPMWFNPAYWHEGALAPMNWANQAAVLRETLRKMASDLWGQKTAALFALGAFALSWRLPLTLQALLRWPALWAAAAFGMYSLVAHNYRYAYPFLFLSWAAFLLPRPSAGEERGHWRKPLLAAATVVFLAQTGWALAEGFRPPGNWSYAAAAEDLRGLGVRPGDRLVKLRNETDVYFARLAGVTVPLFVPDTGMAALEGASREQTLEWIDRLEEAGADALVTPVPTEGVLADEWTVLGEGLAYALPLADARAALAR